MDIPHRSPAHVLAARASAEPTSLAFTYLRGGELTDASVVTLTQGELNRRARNLAAELRQSLSVGDRAVLLYPPGLDFVVALYACFYAGVVAVPAYPPDLNRLARTLPRLQAIIADANASAVLTTTPIEMIAEGMFDLAPSLRELRWISTDMDSGAATPDTFELPADSAVAFLQYTSGSTGSPKGVMVTHGNLAVNTRTIVSHHRLGRESSIVSWLPQYHDMGLVGGMLSLMLSGGHSVLLSPMDFLQQPLRWLRAIAKYGSDIVTAPNFAYDLCVRKTTPEQRREIDLSKLRHALNGAEPVRLETMQRFAAAFAESGFRFSAFRHAYGLAEATLMVAINAASAENAAQVVHASADSLASGLIQPVPAGTPKSVTFVTCGAPTDQEVRVVNPKTREACEPLRVGEIWVRGPNVASGYWASPEATQATFEARLASGSGPFLRTGDLGFVANGELFITGRMKDLIIVRGKNHYPSDIELTAEQCHAALRPGCGVAFSFEQDGEERAAVVYELDERAGATPDAVSAMVYQSVLLGHELTLDSVVLIASRSLPKTSSGKVMRGATRDAFLAGKLETLSTWKRDDGSAAEGQASREDSLRGWMLRWCAETLRLPVEQIDPAVPVASYGLNSLAAVEFAQALSQKLGREIESQVLFDFPSIDALCAYLDVEGGTRAGDS